MACAPLLGGALTATAVVSSLGALLPASLASGATFGAVGAFVPATLKKCKAKLVAKFRGGSSSADANFDRDDVEPAPSTPREERVASAATLALACATWAVVLELQGAPEDEIAASAPVALQPLEDCAFEDVASAQDAFACARAILAKIPATR